MCEANAYIMEEDKEKLVMEAVDTVEPVEDGVLLVSIFGEQKFIRGYIYSLSLVGHKVYIKPQ
ncbi:MAG: CooT family nickel-binding protein [Pseudomonadota bacterium]